MTDFRSNYYIDHGIETITMTQEIDHPFRFETSRIDGC